MQLLKCYAFTIMVNESLTSRLARERLAAIKAFIPLRDRVREKLQRRQEAQTDFSTSTEQLFSPKTAATKDVTARTKPLLGALEKVAAETGQTREVLKTLPTDIVTTSRQQQRKDRMLEQIRQRQPQPIGPIPDQQQPYVELADDEEELQGATAREPEEEELLQGVEQLIQKEQQSTIWRGNVPKKIL